MKTLKEKIVFIVLTTMLYLTILSAYSQTPTIVTSPTPTVISIPTHPSRVTTPAVTPTPKPSPLSVQEDSDNSLGLIFSVKKIEEANNLLAEGKTDEAEKKLNEIKGWLINATDYHYNLYQVINKNSKTEQAAKIEKAHALDFANLRDQAFYLLARIYISQNKLKEATKLLTDIVKSQSESELGKDAYKTLLEIKFSDQVK